MELKLSKEEQIKIGHAIFSKYEINDDIYDTSELRSAYMAGIVDGYKELLLKIIKLLNVE
jgi:hypothetical protein